MTVQLLTQLAQAGNVDEFKNICDESNLDLILLVAPTSGNGRISKIAAKSKGFIYLVSSVGVTGVRDGFSSVLGDIITQIKKVSSVPIAVGFGVSKSEHIENLKDLNVYGAIVGSAIIKIIQENKDDAELVKTKVSEFIDDLYGETH